MLGSYASDSFFIYLLWLPWNPPFTKQETDKGHEQREMLKPNQERKNRSPSQQGFPHFICSVTSCAECLSVGPRSCHHRTGTRAGKCSQFWQRPDPREPRAGVPVLGSRRGLRCSVLPFVKWQPWKAGGSNCQLTASGSKSELWPECHNPDPKAAPSQRLSRPAWSFQPQLLCGMRVGTDAGQRDRRPAVDLPCRGSPSLPWTSRTFPWQAPALYPWKHRDLVSIQVGGRVATKNQAIWKLQV